MPNNIKNNKKCGGCKTNRNKRFFSNSKLTKDGLQGHCKNCFNETNDKLKLDALKAISSKLECVMHKKWKCCGNPKDIGILSIDHINNDGVEHKKAIRSEKHTTILSWTINNPERAKKKLQILCHNAQWMKERMNRKNGAIERTKKAS